MGDTPGRTGKMNIDSKLVRELAQLLSDTGLSEIEVEDGERKIRVACQFTAAAPAPVYAPAPVAAAPAAAPSAAPAEAPAAAPVDAVKSPMVGTVYLAAEPGAASAPKPAPSSAIRRTAPRPVRDPNATAKVNTPAPPPRPSVEVIKGAKKETVDFP